MLMLSIHDIPRIGVRGSEGEQEKGQEQQERGKCVCLSQNNLGSKKQYAWANCDSPIPRLL